MSCMKRFFKRKLARAQSSETVLVQNQSVNNHPPSQNSTSEDTSSCSDGDVSNVSKTTLKASCTTSSSVPKAETSGSQSACSSGGSAEGTGQAIRSKRSKRALSVPSGRAGVSRGSTSEQNRPSLSLGKGASAPTSAASSKIPVRAAVSQTQKAAEAAAANKAVAELKGADSDTDSFTNLRSRTASTSEPLKHSQENTAVKTSKDTCSAAETCPKITETLKYVQAAPSHVKQDSPREGSVEIPRGDATSHKLPGIPSSPCSRRTVASLSNAPTESAEKSNSATQDTQEVPTTQNHQERTAVQPPEKNSHEPCETSANSISTADASAPPPDVSPHASARRKTPFAETGAVPHATPGTVASPTPENLVTQTAAGEDPQDTSLQHIQHQDLSGGPAQVRVEFQQSPESRHSGKGVSETPAETDTGFQRATVEFTSISGVSSQAGEAAADLDEVLPKCSPGQLSSRSGELPTGLVPEPCTEFLTGLTIQRKPDIESPGCLTEAVVGHQPQPDVSCTPQAAEPVKVAVNIDASEGEVKISIDVRKDTGSASSVDDKYTPQQHLVQKRSSGDCLLTGDTEEAKSSVAIAQTLLKESLHADSAEGSHNTGLPPCCSSETEGQGVSLKRLSIPVFVSANVPEPVAGISALTEVTEDSVPEVRSLQEQCVSLIAFSARIIPDGGLEVTENATLPGEVPTSGKPPLSTKPRSNTLSRPDVACGSQSGPHRLHPRYTCVTVHPASPPPATTSPRLNERKLKHLREAVVRSEPGVMEPQNAQDDHRGAEDLLQQTPVTATGFQTSDDVDTVASSQQDDQTTSVTPCQHHLAVAVPNTVIINIPSLPGVPSQDTGSTGTQSMHLTHSSSVDLQERLRDFSDVSTVSEEFGEPGSYFLSPAGTTTTPCPSLPASDRVDSHDTLDEAIQDGPLSDTEVPNLEEDETEALMVYGPMPLIPPVYDAPILVEQELLNDIAEELALASETAQGVAPEVPAPRPRSPRMQHALPDVVLLERVVSPDLSWSNKGRRGVAKDSAGKSTRTDQLLIGKEGTGLRPVTAPQVTMGNVDPLEADREEEGDQGEEEVEEEYEEDVDEEVVPMTGLMDVFQLTQAYDDNRQLLQSAHKRYGKMQKKLATLQKSVVHQTRELAELSRLITLTETQVAALKEEKRDLDVQLQKSCDLVNLDNEGEARKYEPLIYKKYIAAKTGPEVRALLSTIRSRQKALHYLEAMTFRKCVSIQHNFKLEEKKSTEKDQKPCNKKLLNLSAPAKKPRKNKDMSALVAPMTTATTSLLPLMLSVGSSSASVGSASTGTVSIGTPPSEQQQQQQQHHQPLQQLQLQPVTLQPQNFLQSPLQLQNISVFGTPSAGTLSLDDFTETQV